MTALVIVDLKIKDEEKWQVYAESAGPTVAKHGGELLGKGMIESLQGEISHPVKVVLKFADKETAKGWYNSEEYQALIPNRNQGADLIFHLI